MSKPLSIFISYAHADESFKDRLLSHLTILQRQKLVHNWEDRQIDGGSDWRADIMAAMDGCDLALLLISDAFLASEFIQSVEMTHLLARRASAGIRVVPINRQKLAAANVANFTRVRLAGSRIPLLKRKMHVYCLFEK